MPSPQPGITLRAGELDALLKVLDSYQSLVEVDVTCLHPQRLGYAAAEVKQ